MLDGNEKVKEIFTLVCGSGRNILWGRGFAWDWGGCSEGENSFDVIRLNPGGLGAVARNRLRGNGRL